MSRDVAALVLSRRFGSVTRKAVALVLGDHASIQDDGRISTIVGQKRIASEAEVSERTVRNILSEFESEGLISRETRMRAHGRGRTSDRIVIHRPALSDLPEAVAGKSSDQPATDDDQPEAPSGKSHDQPETGARPTGKAIAGEEPSENRKEEEATTSTQREELPMLPAERWARTWCTIRGIPDTRAVLKSFIPAVQEFMQQGGEPSQELLELAAREGIQHPSGWSFVAGNVRAREEADRVQDWLKIK